MSDLLPIASAVVEDARRKSIRAQYREDPVLWAKDIAGIHLWSLQADIARSVQSNKDVAVKAGHGVGKSLLAAILICWWIDTRYPHCFVASTAPSTAQIGAIVWREVRNIYNRVAQRYEEGLIDHKLPGYITAQHEWKNHDGVLMGFGRKPPDQKTDDAFQGIHAQEGVLAIGDEAVGLTEEMVDALGNITSNASSRRFLICNPTNPASYVGRLFKSKPSNWTFHTISVFDSPNFTGEEIPEEARHALTDESYVNSKREEYGEGTPRWMSRVLGEFAWDMGYTLIRPEDVAKGLDCEIDPRAGDYPVLGVDVSRSKAGDKNTVYLFKGGYLRLIDSWNEPNSVVTARRINQLALENRAVEVRIDGVGLGGPIADYVRDVQYEDAKTGAYDVIEILGGDPSPDKKRWYNMRAWMYWSFQDRLSKSMIDLDPSDQDLQDELMSVEIKKKVAGLDTLLLESKEEMRKRGVHSPDHADAAMYASIDISAWTGNEYNKMNVGDVVAKDPSEMEIGDLFADAIEF